MAVEHRLHNDELQIKHVGGTTVRKTVASGHLPEIEYGLLKKYSDRLSWGTPEKQCLLDMSIDHLSGQVGPLKFDIELRSLCHSRDVNCEYLKFTERYNMKHTVLVLGEVGIVDAPWAQLIQPAVHLHMHEYNVIMLSIAEFAHDPCKWFTYGPQVIRGILEYLHLEKVTCLATGVGGAVFLEALAEHPELFGSTHMVFNLDLPPSGDAGVPVTVLEDFMRERELQLWFTYVDHPPTYDRNVDGGACTSYEQVSKLKTRLEGERRRGRRSLHYDELLVTDQLNNVKTSHADPVPIGNIHCLRCSKDFLRSFTEFFAQPPHARQEGVDLNGGLIPDNKTAGLQRMIGTKPLAPAELPALRRQRLGPNQQHRHKVAIANRSRMDHLDAIMGVLGPPAQRRTITEELPIPEQAALRLARGAAARGSKYRATASKLSQASVQSLPEQSDASRSSTIDVLASAMMGDPAAAFLGDRLSLMSFHRTTMPELPELPERRLCAASPSLRSGSGSRAGSTAGSLAGSRQGSRQGSSGQGQLPQSQSAPQLRPDSRASQATSESFFDDDDDDDDSDYAAQWRKFQSILNANA